MLVRILHLLIALIGAQVVRWEMSQAQAARKGNMTCSSGICIWQVEPTSWGRLTTTNAPLLFVQGDLWILEGNVTFSGFSSVSIEVKQLDCGRFGISADQQLSVVGSRIVNNMQINADRALLQGVLVEKVILREQLGVQFVGDGVRIVDSLLNNQNGTFLEITNLELVGCTVVNSTLIQLGSVFGLLVNQSNIINSNLIGAKRIENVVINGSRFSQTVVFGNEEMKFQNLLVSFSELVESELIRTSARLEIDTMTLFDVVCWKWLINAVGRTIKISNLEVSKLQSRSMFKLAASVCSISQAKFSQILDDNDLLIFDVQGATNFSLSNVTIQSICQIKLLEGEGLTYFEIEDVLFEEIYNTKKYLIEIRNANSVKMRNIRAKNIIVDYKGLILIEDTATSILMNLELQDITGGKSTGLVKLLNGQNVILSKLVAKQISTLNGTFYFASCNVTLTNSSFSAIQAYAGAALYGENIMIHVSGSRFENMSSQIGGSLFLTYSGIHSQLFDNISLSNVSFINSTAQVGPHVYLKTSKITKPQPDFYTDGPVYIQIFNKSYEISNLAYQSYNVSYPDVKSGQDIPIKMWVLNSNNQTICDKFDEITFNLSPMSYNSSLCHYEFVYQIRLDQPQNISQIENIQFQQQNATIFIEFQIIDCEIGEVWRDKTCYRCEAGKYSLNPRENKCFDCPSSVLACPGGATLNLRTGYWRPNNLTDKISACTISSNQCEGGSGNFTCSEGFVGALCNDCDYEAVHWPMHYTQSMVEGCVECQFDLVGSLKGITSLIWILLALTISVKGALKMVKAQLQGYYLKLIGILFATRSMMVIDQTELLIKIFTGYFQLASMIMVLEVEVPEFINHLIYNVGSPLKSLMVSTECLILTMDLKQEIIYLKQLWSIVFSVFLILLFVVAYWLLRICARHSFNSTIIFQNTLIQVFYYFQGDIIQGMLSLVFCIEASGEYYIQAATQYHCYTESHYFHIYVMILPIITIMAFILPGFYLAQLLKHKQKLWTCRFRLKYGYLFTEYKDQFYYWEFIKMLLKITFFTLQTILIQQIKLMFLLAILCLISYEEYLQIRQPYIDRRFNNLEKRSIQLVIVTLVLAFFQDQNPNQILVYISQTLCFLLNGGYLVYFSYRVFLEMCHDFKQSINNKIIDLLNQYPHFSRYIKKPRAIELKSRVQHLWKVARTHVLQFIKELGTEDLKNKSDSNSNSQAYSVDLSPESKLLQSLKPGYLKLIYKKTSKDCSYQMSPHRDHSPQTRDLSQFSQDRSPSLIAQHADFSTAISAYMQKKPSSPPSPTTITQVLNRSAKIYPEKFRASSFLGKKKLTVTKAF